MRDAELGLLLLNHAREAALRASAPYSNFPVGAAVIDANGVIYRGCNIESASYGLTVCAERVAIFSAVSAGSKPVAIAVACICGNSEAPQSLTPCGACRQVMLDQMDESADVWIDGVGRYSVGQLLPLGFHLPDDHS